MSQEFNAYCYKCNKAIKTHRGPFGQECPFCCDTNFEWLGMTAMWHILQNFGRRIKKLEEWIEKQRGNGQ